MSEYRQKTRPDGRGGWTPRDPLGGDQPPGREPPPPPPPGWDEPNEAGQMPRGSGGASPRGDIPLSSLFLVIDGLRRALPRDLQEQFTSLVREVLLTLRSLIDWYLDRLDGRRREPSVEDIPID